MNDDADDLLARIIEIAVHTRADENGRIRLPTERELSETLQVQRPTVRDRLTVLETLGFLQRRQGSGTFLSLPNSQFLQFYFEVSMKLGFISIDQMQRALEMMGLEMVSTAAIQSSNTDITQLEETVETMRNAKSINDFVEAQLMFHTGLAQASHNTVISLLIDGLAKVIRTVFLRRVRVISLVQGALDRNVDAHMRVMQSLKDREPEMAREAMLECYALWRREASKISSLDLQE